MAYNHNNQYRITIVRGKAQADLDNLLPLYAQILEEICPIDEDVFAEQFNSKLVPHLQTNVKKTLDNHRTEIAGKLFGLYYDSDNTVYISERALKLLDDSDQPAFFKDLCSKYQFPTGMTKMPMVLSHVKEGISIRQFSFLLKVLMLLEAQGVSITKKQVGYYILNSLDVLTRKATPTEVVAQILSDVNNDIYRVIETPNKASSYDYQHINEQINLLVLANLIFIQDGDLLKLNSNEDVFINAIADKYADAPKFDFAKLDLSTVAGRNDAELEWVQYFGKLTDEFQVDSTSAQVLTRAQAQIGVQTIIPRRQINTIELGDEGEQYIFDMEVNRVKPNHPRLVNKIKKMGKIKGIGYDIQSVIGTGRNPDFVRYIEVKSTKRVTQPDLSRHDTIKLTRNEWIAAEQHGKIYFIYRVYFFQGGVNVFVIENPFDQYQQNNLNVAALEYRMDFDRTNGAFI